MHEPLKLADFPLAARELYTKVAKEYAMLGGDTRRRMGAAAMPACLLEALRSLPSHTTKTGALQLHCEDNDEHHRT